MYFCAKLIKKKQRKKNILTLRKAYCIISVIKGRNIRNAHKMRVFKAVFRLQAVRLECLRFRRFSCVMTKYESEKIL